MATHSRILAWKKEPVLIEILVEVMDPSFVCLVSQIGRASCRERV